MKTATTVSHESLHRLEQAFAVFNRVSADLDSSYRDLELKVQGLHAELAIANTQRLRELTAREQLAAKLSALMEALPGGVLTLNAKGQIEEANPAALEILGADYRGEDWQDVLAKLVTETSINRSEVSLRNGRRVSLRDSVYGDLGQTIVLLTDITENHELNCRINREQRLAALGEMAARLAHQVRTPLSAAMLKLSRLNARGADKDSEEVVNGIRNRLNQIEKLIEGMLAYIRGDISASQEFAVYGLLGELQECCATLLEAVDGKLTIVAPYQDLCINGDRQALLNALCNLVENAVQAARQTPDVTVSLARGENCLHISVADNGPGIDADIREQIFDPFFSARMGGTGLGLAVVRSVVMAHRGKITVTNPPLGGTVFTLSLPCQSDESVDQIGIWSDTGMGTER